MSDEQVAQTPIKMRYKNWRGEVSNRSILPVGTLERKATEYHPEPQWIMRAWDFDKQAYRDFALADCDFAAMQPTPQEAAKVLLGHCESGGADCGLQGLRKSREGVQVRRGSPRYRRRQ